MSESNVFFDDVEVKQYQLIYLQGHEHPLAQATRDRFVKIAERPGAIDYGADLEPIPFNLPFAIIGNDKFELQHIIRDFKSVLIDSKGKPRTFKLRFGYETDKYYNVRYSGQVPIERLMRTGEFELPLICYDGHAWSVVKNDEVTWGSTLITFASTSYTFGHRGSGAKTFTSPGTTIVTSTGANIKPIIHITGSGTNVKIAWNGKSINLGTFVNSTWEIDLAEYEITKNGVNALNTINQLNPDGTWFDMELLPGENQIVVNGSGLNLTFRVEFRDRYF